MTKKDYILIAETIRAQVDSARDCLNVPYEGDLYYDKHNYALAVLEDLTSVFSGKLAAQNERFDRKVFRTACLGDE